MKSALPLKVCGLTRASDVSLCLELGVAFTGFIFAPGSPRRLKPEAAAALPRGPAARVGVFAGQDLSEVRRIMKIAGLDYAQLHGGEGARFCRALGPERVIKTLWPQKLTPSSFMEERARFAPLCAFFLLDAGQGGGGSGRNLDWATLADLDLGKPWFLAGGLTPENLPLALAACSPWAVDCNSGLEEAERPGCKDSAKLRAAASIVRKWRK